MTNAPAARAARGRRDLAVRPSRAPRRRTTARSRIGREPRGRGRHVDADRRRRREGDGGLHAVPRPRVRRSSCCARKRCAGSPTCSSRTRRSSSCKATCSLSAAASAARSRCTRSCLKTYPDYKKNDLVLYQLARAYEADGRLDESLATLDRLSSRNIRRRRTSTRRSFAAARRCSSRSAITTPSVAYDAVLKHGSTSQFYQQSLYKHGWSLFKQQQYEKSLGSFFALARP